MISKEFMKEIAEKLTLEEGYASHIYKCPAGYNTVGIGHNIDANPLPMDVLKLLFEKKVDEAIETLFNRDVLKVVAQLERYFPWWGTQPDNIRLFMIDFVFNVGIGTARKFKNTMKYLQREQYERAAEGLLNSRYARQVPNRAKRNAELIRLGRG